MIILIFFMKLSSPPAKCYYFMILDILKSLGEILWTVLLCHGYFMLALPPPKSLEVQCLANDVKNKHFYRLYRFH